MKLFRSILAGAALLMMLAAQSEPLPEITASTAHLQEILQRLTGGASVKTLIPPAMCPGHFDVRPGDIARLQRGGVLFIHTWQQRMPNIQAVIKAAALPEARLRVVDAPGNWMAAPAREGASAAVTRLLAELMPGQAEAIMARDTAYRKTIRARGEAVRAQVAAAGAANTAVMCDAIIEDLLTWMGFQVLATFGRSEDVGAASMAALVRLGHEKRVALVVDNLQSSGARLGPAIARDINAAHAVISNFPGGFDDTPDWETTLDRNARVLIEAFGQRRLGHE